MANDGPPLPAAMEGRLFDSMVSVRPDPPIAGPHLGLGLYIARLVAEFHRGSIELHNRADGRGVVARVAMPVA